MFPTVYLRWQLKYLRVATRFGLLAEACLALLFLPILRGLALFRVLGVQFEASVRYHIWLGTTMILFATIHGGSTLFIWGISHHIQDEVMNFSSSHREDVFIFSLRSSYCFQVFRIITLSPPNLFDKRYGNGKRLAGYSLLGRLL